MRKREERTIATESAVPPAVCMTKPNGNTAAIREALYMMRRISDEMNGETFGKGDEKIVKGWADTLRYYSDKALSKTPRNCYVGTEEWKQDKEPSPSRQREEGDSGNPECLKKDSVDIVPQIGSVGNTVAMREALEEIVGIVSEWQGSIPLGKVCKIAKAALSEPPRNCDNYDNKTDAETGFVEETGEDDREQHYWQMFANWLFWKAEGRKGETDGSK